MKKMIFLPTLLLMMSCSTEPKPIVYGSDACDFCEMTIVSEVFSARAVSNKGKQFKYDAIECLVNDLQQKEIEMAVLQVADYSEPGKMIDVNNAFFIINDSINSPMGANLAAVNRENRLVKETGVFSWNALFDHFLQKDAPSTNTER